MLCVAMVSASSALLLVVDGPAALGRHLVANFGALVVGGALSFAVLGVLVVARHPRHAVGWLALTVASGFALAQAAGIHGALAVPRDWAGAQFAVWVGQWAWAPSFLLIPTLLTLLLPDGRLPSPRWRIVATLDVVAVAVGTASWMFAPYDQVDLLPVAGAVNPVGLDLPSWMGAVGGAMMAAAVIASVTGAVTRYVRSSRGARAQFQWVALGVLGTVAIGAVGIVLGPDAAWLSGVAVLGLPVGIGLAVLHHRLWDVEVVIDRGIVYGLVSAGILALYAGTVAVAGQWLGASTGTPLLATALVAVAVQPLRTVAQRFATHLRYGDRGDPFAALNRLGEQLDAAGDRVELLSDVVDAVRRALHVAGVAVVVEGRAIAVSGQLQNNAVTVPLRLRGSEVGLLRVAPRHGEELTAADHELLAQLGRHVAVAVHAETLHHELERSRAALVAAREEERRRLRRDLHDELGPSLAAIRLEVESAAVELANDPSAALRRLDNVSERVRDAVRDVRGLVEELRPAALDELGLEGAVRHLARALGGGTGPHVEVHAEGDLTGLPAAVDVAVYRIVAEALTNVVRHAAANRATVLLRRSDTAVEIEIRDDGQGMAVTAPLGVGLRSMTERAAEVGGSLELGATEGEGTVVRTRLPLVVPE